MQNKNQVVDLQDYRAAEEAARTPADASPQHLPAGTALLVGQYKITGYLNCGGFGITYRADDSLGREVLIKECFPGEMVFRDGKSMRPRSPKYAEELRTIVKHFVKEAHRQARVQHDNVVHVHQIFEENDTAYIVMDFVDGLDLLDIMEHDPTLLGPLQVERLVCQMLDAIGFVHDLGLLHRDISPDNILIDRRGNPVLIDFGSAHENVATRRLSRLKFVKDGYSPQEFYIAGSEQGAWSDLYSFAASMYHVITGAPPLDAQSRLAALAARKGDPYVPLVGHVKGYSRQFLGAIDKALSTLPEDRLQSAREWLDLLAAAPNAATVAALDMIPTPPDAEENDHDAPRAREAVRNRLHPAIAAGIAGFVILGSAGILALGGGSDPDPSLDLVVQGVQEGRDPTPPLVAAAPIENVAPEIGTTPELAAPSLAFRQPPLPAGLQPIGRAQQLVSLSTVELVSVPRVIVADLPDAFGATAAVTTAPVLGALQEPQSRVVTSVTGVSPLPDAAEQPGAAQLVRPDAPDAIGMPQLGIDVEGFAAAVEGEPVGLAFADPAGVVRGIVPQYLPGYWLDTPPPVEPSPRMVRRRR